MASIDVASSVDPGTDLAFVVVLENRSNHDLPLDPCPAFVEQLGRDGGTYQLNCTVRTLPASSWIRLQMRLAVSASAPAGAEQLSWAIDINGEVEWAHRVEACGGFVIPSDRVEGRALVLGGSCANGDGSNGNIQARGTWAYTAP